MLHIGYIRCEYECRVYLRSLSDNFFIFLLLYVDGMLIAFNHLHDELKIMLKNEFDIKYLDAAKKIIVSQCKRIVAGLDTRLYLNVDMLFNVRHS